MRKVGLLLIAALITIVSFAQTNDILQAKMDSVRSILLRLPQAQNDSVRKVMGDRAANFFQEILMHPKAWKLDYSSLSDVMKILETDDHLLRIFTWGIKLTDDYYYYGFVQRYDKKNHTTYFYRLFDKSNELKDPDKQYLDGWHWYGCIYYQVFTNKYKRKTIYTLLGTDPDGDLLNRKIIDVLTFRGNGPRFGFDFKNEFGQPVKRFIFEYNNQATMLLRWDNRLGMIIFDHLSPSEPKYKGLHQFYGPDFSYDGLKFVKGKWIYQIDLDVRAPKKD